MAYAPFDATKAVTFDLQRGQVRLPGAPPSVLVPGEALVDLCEAAGDAAIAALGASLGEGIGRRVSARLGGSSEETRGQSVEAVVDHLGGELALAGLGVLEVERWGRALVLVVGQCPFGEKGDRLLAPVLEAALLAATGRRGACVKLARDERGARFLVIGDAGAEKVRGWLLAGAPWGEVLARLHDERAIAGESA